MHTLYHSSWTTWTWKQLLESVAKLFLNSFNHSVHEGSFSFFSNTEWVKISTCRLHIQIASTPAVERPRWVRPTLWVAILIRLLSVFMKVICWQHTINYQNMAYPVKCSVDCDWKLVSKFHCITALIITENSGWWGCFLPTCTMLIFYLHYLTVRQTGSRIRGQPEMRCQTWRASRYRISHIEQQPSPTNFYNHLWGFTIQTSACKFGSLFCVDFWVSKQ